MGLESTWRIGWIGTGVMGSSMCGHLLKGGNPTMVFNRTPHKVESLRMQGAVPAESVAEVAKNSNLIFTIVGYPSDVRQVYLGTGGILENAQPGSIVVDMTTSPPSLAQEIDEVARSRGIESLDAPVSGGDIGAREARLSIMVGGKQEVFERVLPFFEKMGKTIILQGGPGAGQHTKLVNQTLIASNMVGVCEALLYGFKANLDLEKVLASVSTGAAGSWSLSNLAPRIMKRDFEPGFFVDHFVKDMGIVLDECRRMKLALPGIALAHQLYVALQAQGGGAKGTQALLLALASLSNIEW